MTSEPKSPQAVEAGQGDRITALLVNQGGKQFFKLTWRGESVPLVDTSALNRWVALGVTGRHNLGILPDGVTIDGYKVSFENPQAPAELERLLNLLPVPRHPAHAASASQAAPPPSSAQDTQRAREFTEAVHVNRDGFEFHVTFKTRFGENKNEKLERALEIFQNMRVFRPHVNLQKAGIRLVVTRWDGENFIEEHGIENLEHASPEQVEELIRTNLAGYAGGSTLTSVSAPPTAAVRAVIHLGVSRKPHELRFHFVLHRADGTSEDGPLLLRANAAKWTSFFRRDVTVSMTALSDGVIIDYDELVNGQQHRRTKNFPLRNEDEARVLEGALNSFLKVSEPLTEPMAPPVEQASVVAQETGPESVPPQFSAAPKVAPAPEPMEETGPDVAPPVVSGPSEKQTPESQTEQAKETGPPVVSDQGTLFTKTAALSPERINHEIFLALRDWSAQAVVENDHGLPSFTLQLPNADGDKVPWEIIHSPHYLLFSFPSGYFRFGLETRAGLNRLHDFLSFPHHALVGVGLAGPGGHLQLMVAEKFLEFVTRQSERAFRNELVPFLQTPKLPTSSELLIWPCHRESRLFMAATTIARDWGLPVTADTIVLDPQADHFVGFRKTGPTSLEFRAGDDAIQCKPDGVDLIEEGVSHQFSGDAVILGWALDQEGRVCALYRKASGFIPPATTFVRFLSEAEKEAETGLTILGYVPEELT